MFLGERSELLIDAASASEHRPRRSGGIRLAYTDPPGERQRAPFTSRCGHPNLPGAVIYLGKSEPTVGLAFRFLSRAKRLVDILVESMPFDRLSKLGDKSTLKIRLGSASSLVVIPFILDVVCATSRSQKNSLRAVSVVCCNIYRSLYICK